MHEHPPTLVAVGGGLAGLVAAGRMLELGGSAVVLERSADPKHLCASRVNGGIFHLGFRSVDAPADELQRIVTQATEGFVTVPLARALARHAGRSAQWLARAGVEFTRMEPDEGWKDKVLAPVGFHDSTSFVWKGLGGDRLIDRLEARLLAQGGELRRGTRATGLAMDHGRCVGVFTDGPDGARLVPATAVVLADGGFQADGEMLRRFVGPHPERLKLRGLPGATGDGIRFAEAAGARLVGMDTFYGHLLSADSLHRDGLCPFPFLDLLAAAGVLVDAEGLRFVDEGRGPHAMSNALARHGDCLATVVFDDAMWNEAGREFFCPPNPNLVKAGGTLHRADDLDALAALAGLPAAALRRTIEAHDAAVAAGTIGLLTPPRSARKHAPRPFATPPYYAAPVCAAITHTMGGVAVDDEARVLGVDDRPIAGLYAAGATCGGLEGGPEAAYLGGLVMAVVFGLLAAETAALAGAAAR
jgi:fumarate reductase flavoprotein subunit